MSATSVRAQPDAAAAPRGADVLQLPSRRARNRLAAASQPEETPQEIETGLDRHDATADGQALDEGTAAEWRDDAPAGLAEAAAPAHAAARSCRAAAAPLADPDDALLGQWIERIARQDERALEALYDALAPRVHGLVLRITRRAALAEEVLEDTFWQVWRQAPRFDAARGRPITWLLAMARSRAIDALRREQRFRHEELPEDDLAEAVDGAGAPALPPQDLLEATRGQAHVHAALASLEPRSRQLVALAFFRGLTHEEIAEQQQMPLGTVKSLIRRALQQLKRVMEAEHA
jgi:RNA polymerase sigma-70 factor (ECF subfamily)